MVVIESVCWFDLTQINTIFAMSACLSPLGEGVELTSFLADDVVEFPRKSFV